MRGEPPGTLRKKAILIPALAAPDGWFPRAEVRRESQLPGRTEAHTSKSGC